MKKLTILTFLLTVFISYSQQNNYTLKTENLKGDVMSYQKETFIIDKTTQELTLKYKEKKVFNHKGAIIRIENYGNDATLDSKELYTYKNDKLTIVTTFNSTGKKDKSTLYEYDDLGRLVAQKKVNSTGKPQYLTTYLYNQKGLLAAQHKLIPSINYTMKESYTYNAKGQKIEIAKTARIGTTKVQFSYNGKGQLIKKSEYNAMGELYSVIKYEYNSNDDKISLKKYDADGLMTYDEKYEYTYDPKGNWVQKLSFEKGEKVSVEKREIIYNE